MKFPVPRLAHVQIADQITGRFTAIIAFLMKSPSSWIISAAAAASQNDKLRPPSFQAAILRHFPWRSPNSISSQISGAQGRQFSRVSYGSLGCSSGNLLFGRDTDLLWPAQKSESELQRQTCNNDRNNHIAMATGRIKGSRRWQQQSEARRSWKIQFWLHRLDSLQQIHFSENDF